MNWSGFSLNFFLQNSQVEILTLTNFLLVNFYDFRLFGKYKLGYFPDMSQHKLQFWLRELILPLFAAPPITPYEHIFHKFHQNRRGPAEEISHSPGLSTLNLDLFCKNISFLELKTKI